MLRLRRTKVHHSRLVARSASRPNGSAVAIGKSAKNQLHALARLPEQVADRRLIRQHCRPPASSGQRISRASRGRLRAVN
jgi:hypothetical protein